MLGFDRSQLDALTIEHVPPKSIGGNGVLLTCKECNNRAGTRLENDIRKREHLTEQAQILFQEKQGLSSKQILVELHSEQLQASLAREGDLIDITVPQKYNNPHTLSKVGVSTRLHQGPLSFKVTSGVSYSKRAVKLAELKTVYLLLFALFGYRYVCNPRAQYLGRLLQSALYTDRLDTEVKAPVGYVRHFAGISERELCVDESLGLVLVRLNEKIDIKKKKKKKKKK